MTRALRLSTFIGGLACALQAGAETFPLSPEGQSLVGEVRTVRTLGPDDTLADVALRHGVGFRELVLANPSLDAWLPPPDSEVVLPTQFVLPSGPRRGIVVNVAEMRMYYYPQGQDVVMTWPVSVGRENWKTPLGVASIKSKVKNPTWYPPESIRAEHAAEGTPLPRAVPPGPDNPLGPLALRLDWNGILIHGTNKPYGIGMPVTHGCLRMQAEHMQELFDAVPVGTPVAFIDEPYKVGRYDGALYLEAHVPPEDPRLEALPQEVRVIDSDPAVLARWLKQARGLPVRLQTIVASGGSAAGASD